MKKSERLTIREAADRLNASRATISRWCRKGKFPNAEKIVTRFGDHWEIPEQDLAGVEVKIGRPKKV